MLKSVAHLVIGKTGLKAYLGPCKVCVTEESLNSQSIVA